MPEDSNENVRSTGLARLVNPALGLASALLALGVIELGLRVAGVDPLANQDPLSGFVGTPDAFALVGEEDGDGRFVALPGKVDTSQSFPARKADGTFRIFLLGGSTTYGQPYGPDGSFSRWIRDGLQARYPDRAIEVVNAGVPGFGSMRVLQIMKEAVAYDPDLFVLYTGQNEFRDARFHYWDITRPDWMARSLAVLLRSRTFALALAARNGLIAQLTGERQVSYGGEMIAGVLEAPFSERTFPSYPYYLVPRPVMARPPPTTEAPRPNPLKLAVKKVLRVGYMELTHEKIVEHFRDNLAEMKSVASENGIPLLLLVPARNPKVRDVLLPSIILVRDQPEAEDWAERWEAAYRDGLNRLRGDDPAGALDDFDRALEGLGREPDPLTHLYRGLAYQELGDRRAAAKEFEERLTAEYLDVAEAAREFASATGTPVLDVYELFRTAGDGIVGYENFFVDAVHMTLEGYRLVGRTVTDVIVENGWVPGVPAAPMADSTFSTAPSFDSPELDATLGWTAFNQGDLEEALERANRALATGFRRIS